jgi:multidrug resistance efflux pump
MVPRKQVPKKQINAKMAILLKIAKAEKIKMPYQAMLYIAIQMNNNAQDLRSALDRVTAYSILKNREIDALLAAEALQDFIPARYRGAKDYLKIKDFQKSVTYASTFAIATISSFALLSGCGPNKSLPSASPVAKAEARQGSSQQDVTLTGRAEPYQQVLLSPVIEGNIKNIFIELGASVQKGQKLAQLDDGDLAYRVKQAEVHVNSVQLEAQEKAIDQQISLNQSKVSLTTTSASDLEQAKADVQDAQIALSEAQKNWDRTNSLFQAGAVPKQQMDQADLQKKLAENQWQNAQKLVAVRTSEQSSQQQSAQETSKLQAQSNELAQELADRGIEQAKADLEVIKFQYNNLTLAAPIDGFITGIKARVGAAVSPASPVFEITNLDKLYIKVNVPEALINRLKMGQEATVSFPILGKTVQGKITNIGLLADLSTSTATYPVQVLVDNAKHEVKSGMMAQVTFK